MDTEITINVETKIENKREHTMTERLKVSLPSVLRAVGSAILLTSAGTFLLQGWSTYSHEYRYFLFLAFSYCLAGAAFLCGARLNDSRGARTFMGVAAAFVPVHFAALGGLLLSKFGGSTVRHYYPEILRWTAISPTTAAATTLVGVVCVSVLAYISFLSLVRTEAKLATANYIALNSLLLIPTRDSTYIGLTALLAAGAAIFYELAYFSKTSCMRTPEGKIVRGLIFAPLMILMTRAVFLYSATAALLITIYAVIGGLLFCLAPRYLSAQNGILCQNLAILPFMAAAALFTGEAANIYGLYSYQPIIFGVILGVILEAMACFSIGSKKWLEPAAAAVGIGAMSLQVINTPGTYISMAFIFSSVLTIIYGHTSNRRGVFGYGLLGLALGLIIQLRFAILAHSLSPWIVLSIIGGGVIVLSSLIEQRGSIRAILTRDGKS